MENMLDKERELSLCIRCFNCKVFVPSLSVPGVLSTESLDIMAEPELIPRNRFCQPMKPGGPVRQIGLSWPH
jgi:hypothetical protein